MENHVVISNKPRNNPQGEWRTSNNCLLGRREGGYTNPGLTLAKLVTGTLNLANFSGLHFDSTLFLLFIIFFFKARLR